PSGADSSFWWEAISKRILPSHPFLHVAPLVAQQRQATGAQLAVVIKDLILAALSTFLHPHQGAQVEERSPLRGEQTKTPVLDRMGNRGFRGGRRQQPHARPVDHRVSARGKA